MEHVRQRSRRRRWGLAAALATCLFVVVSLQVRGDESHVLSPDRSVAGTVVDVATGEPLSGATVSIHGTANPVSASGRFRVDVDGPALATVAAPDHLSRVVALDPERAAEIALTPAGEQAVSLRFGGDVMMGRRYYENTVDADAWLSAGATIEDHARALDAVHPLLADADLTVVNLETPLVEDPWFDEARPQRFHQEKGIVFATAPEFAAALASRGVDVVSMANNHTYDALGAGLASTMEALDEAGVIHFGAGRNAAEAWRPAYARRGSSTVGFVGCTTVTGEAHEVSYVAGPRKAGAAACEARRLRKAVAEAGKHADTVVFMLHGGEEYRRTQVPEVAAFSELAVEAGAGLVVNSHPHVIGGIAEYRDVPIIETTGNLLFDQTLWETFLSYLVRADIVDGKVAQLGVDPIVLEGYRPVPVVGPVADAAEQIAAGEMTASQDLLWGTGSMEDLDTATGSGRALLWQLGRYADLTEEAACAGDWGLRLRRSPVSERDVVASPRHRIPVAPGERLSLVADVAMASAGASLEVRWYADTVGASTAVSTLEIAERSGGADCEQVRLDVEVPSGAVAAQPFVRLTPPTDPNLSREVRIDDIRMIRQESLNR